MDFYSSFVQYYDLIFPFRKKTFDFLKSFLSKPTDFILDLGCGTGKLTGAFAKAGYNSHGFDLDEEMIKFASEHFPEATLYNKNILQVSEIKQKFELVYSTGNVVSYLAEPELKLLAKSLFEQITSEGHWIFQTVNWAKFNKNYNVVFPPIQFEKEKLTFHREYTSTPHQSFVKFFTKLSSGNDVIFSGQSELFPLLPGNAERIFEDAGFKLELVAGDFDGNPYGEKSGAAIYVFKKPAG